MSTLVWWNLVKRLLGSSKNRSIPPLQTDDDLICDNFAKCELIIDFFSEQSNLDDSNSTVSEPIASVCKGGIERFLLEPSSLLTRFHQFLLPDDSAIILSDIVEK
jgi:hypothetical protein